MTTTQLKVAILGASGHLGLSLCHFMDRDTDWRISAYARKPGLLVAQTSGHLRPAEINVRHIDEFPDDGYDIILNCVGLGDAGQIARAGAGLMQVTERFDDLILESLAKTPRSLYVAFSSGAIFGRDLPDPIQAGQLVTIDPSTKSGSIGYTIAKLNSEVKHRLNPTLNVVDIRLYGYFSRFQPMVGEYVMSAIVACLSAGEALVTGSVDIVRDYIHPSDLLRLINCCFQARPINAAVDAFSLAPVKKFELLQRLDRDFGLKYQLSDGPSGENASTRLIYYSLDHSGSDIGFTPCFTALDAVVDELKFLLQQDTAL